jgi:adenylosuccinate lyase
VVFKKPISETGSSTMSQKTNPIGIENAMSNFELFDTMASHMVKEFSRSIMQRDLTSSSLLRNLASVLAYFDIACHNMQKDMFQLFPGEYVMDNMYHLLAEHVQCTLKHICGIYDADELVRNHFKGLLNMTQGQYSLAIINILNESGVSAGDKIATASALAVDINNVW